MWGLHALAVYVAGCECSMNDRSWTIMVVGKFTGNLWALRRLPGYVHVVMSVINSTSYCIRSNLHSKMGSRTHLKVDVAIMRDHHSFIDTGGGAQAERLSGASSICPDLVSANWNYCPP